MYKKYQGPFRKRFIRENATMTQSSLKYNLLSRHTLFMPTAFLQLKGSLVGGSRKVIKGTFALHSGVSWGRI